MIVGIVAGRLRNIEKRSNGELGVWKGILEGSWEWRKKQYNKGWLVLASYKVSREMGERMRWVLKLTMKGKDNFEKFWKILEKKLSEKRIPLEKESLVKMKVMFIEHLEVI